MKVLHLKPSDDVRNILNGVSEPTTIYLESGIYRQKLEIAADDVTLIGENRETTIITYDDYAKKIHDDGKEFNTFRTYTLCVTGERVKLSNLTVENSNTDPRTAGQCVALSVNCKNFYAENVDLKSMQDTLFMYPFPDDLVARYSGVPEGNGYYYGFVPQRQLYAEGHALHLFKNCRIYGTVDFIFGGSEAYFKDCEIISVADSRNFGFLAAPSHPLAEKYGFNFIDCDLKAQGAADGTVYLARPWRDFGKCTFINCRADKHIKPELFDKWNDTYRDKTARFAYYNLKCAASPAPVAWCKELTTQQAYEIIERCNAKFKENTR